VEKHLVNSSARVSLVNRINDALPQTQCTRCGYVDCEAYAHAIASGDAAINQCPPGGAEGVERLSRITGSPIQLINPFHGVEAPRTVAFIDEAWCIGCTLCIKACPTDAIMGSHKLMHTVIESCCTGCELCLPVCPVDCINLENVTGSRSGWSAWSEQDALQARSRYEFHKINLQRREVGQSEETAQRDPAVPLPVLGLATLPGAPASGEQHKRAVIEAAMARSRTQRPAKPSDR